MSAFIFQEGRKRLKIVPVIDILGGIVVHAVRGRRKEYQPVKSVLCSSADPLEVASAFKESGFQELYMADLDAIIGNKANYAIYRRIAEKTGLELMVDAGVTNTEQAEKVLESRASKVVIGTETLRSMDFVAKAVEAFGSERVIVSIDLMGSKLLSQLPSGEFAEPLALLSEFQRVGVENFIVLDLARVGSGEGINSQILKAALAKSRVKLFVGGGVRDIDDMLEMQKIGVYGVLAATALHSGKISIEELKRSGLMH
jgi:phosphoribosylformimino-5-aminoimidazole carboxamide ribotide isomerase